MLPLLSPLTDLAVVPIFVNAGAALFPALIAGLASIGALLFKPKELVAAIKRKPWVPVVILALGVGLWLGWPWLGGLFGAAPHGETADAHAAPAVATGASGDVTDWTAVAKRLIELQNAPPTTTTAETNGATTVGTNGTTTTTTPGKTASPIVPVTPAKLGMGVFYRFGPTRSGFDGGKAPAGELKMVWDFPLANTYFFTSPTIMNGRVYAASCLFQGANPVGAIYCLDAKTGKKIWEFTSLKDGKPLKGFFSSPALTSDGKYLVIGQGLHMDADSSLICVDAQTGEYKWHKQTPLHIEGSPAIEGNVVVAGAGAIEGPAPDHKPKGGNIGFVFAMEISTGRELWIYNKVQDPESSPVLKDGIVYIGSGVNGNAVVALKAEGKNVRELWRTPTPYAATGAVTLAGDLVLIGGGRGDYIQDDPNPVGMVMALNAKTGKIAWTTELENAILGAIAVQGTTAVCAGRSGKVVALDMKDGAIKWQRTVDTGEPVLASPAFTGKYVYAVSRTGLMAVINAADGKIAGKKVSINARPGEQGYCFSSPTIVGGRLYVGSENGGLRCYEGTVLE